MNGRYVFRSLWLAALVIAGVAGAAFVTHTAGAVSPLATLPANAPSAPVLFVVTQEQVSTGARDFVQSMADRGLQFLSDETMSMTAKKQAFRRLLKDSFDMATIGRFTLGRYWRTATPEQRREYLGLFEEMVVDVYAERFSEYGGQQFETRSFRPDGTKDTIVTSFIVSPQGPDVQVDWRVRYKSGRYRIVDVIVEGVSMSVTQRSDFSSVIQRGGGDVQVLLAHLRSK